MVGTSYMSGSAYSGKYGAELIETAARITAAGKGILAADESTGTIGKRVRPSSKQKGGPVWHLNQSLGCFFSRSCWLGPVYMYAFLLCARRPQPTAWDNLLSDMTMSPDTCPMEISTATVSLRYHAL